MPGGLQSVATSSRAGELRVKDCERMVNPVLTRRPARGRPGATFKRPWAFWLGVVAITGGVFLHLPMLLSARDDDYMLRGMAFDRWMNIGMVLRRR